MTANDIRLLEIYMWGFNDELDGVTRDTKGFSDVSLIAYDLGKVDAIVSDEVSGCDLKSSETILEEIKKQKTDK